MPTKTIRRCHSTLTTKAMVRKVIPSPGQDIEIENLTNHWWDWEMELLTGKTVQPRRLNREVCGSWESPGRHAQDQCSVPSMEKKEVPCGAGEMALRLRALVALPEVLSSIPSNHMVAHNHL